MTSNWRKTGRAALGLLLGVLVGAWEARAGAPSDSEDCQAPGWLAPESALQLTLRTGRPSVLVITSRASADSAALVNDLRRTADSTLVGRLVTFADMPREQYRRHVERLGLKTFPAVLVYGKDRSGLKLIGHRTGPLDAVKALGWLASLSTPSGPKRAASPPADPGVRRASQDGYPTPPSPQMPYPTPQNVPQAPPPAPPKMGYPPPPPPQPQPMPVPVPVVPVQPAQAPPIYAAPTPQPVVVSTPAQPVVIQPAQPQIIVGPSQAPQITFATANAPQVSYVQPANAPTANAPQQLFMANAPTAGAPTAGAPTAGAPTAGAPVAYAPVAMAPQPMAMAPQPTANAPTAAQSPVLAAALLTNPRLWERLLGALGEHLAQKKNPRIQMGNAPTIANAPVAMAPSALSPTGYAPVAQPVLMAMPAMAPTAMAPMAMGMMVAQPMPGYAPPPGYCPPGYGQPNYGPPPGYGYGPPPGGYGPPAQPPYPPYPPANAPTPQASGAGMAPQGYGQPMPVGPAGAYPQSNQGSLLHRLLHH